MQVPRKEGVRRDEGLEPRGLLQGRRSPRLPERAAYLSAAG